MRSKKLYWDGNKEHAVDTVVIRDGITEIEYKSFEGCEKLEKIILPEGLTSIDGYAFYGCRSLKEIVLPKGLRKSTEIAQKNSAELLTETKTYQQQSLANDEKQAQILTDNTNKIAEMKNSFDKFLKDMAENYSNELINALNKSMEKLNTQLQTQFGENFKELNAAVREVVTWQRQYKDVVTSTTEELQAINKVFTDFKQTISVNIENQIAALTQNLKTFSGHIK